MTESPTAMPHHDVDADALGRPIDGLPQPWGFWSTLGWELLAFALGAAIVGGGVLWFNWNQLETLPDTQEDPWFPLQFIVSNVVQVAVLAIAARLARWPVAQYLGLTRPRLRDLAEGFAALALAMGALEILTHLLDRGSVTPFQTDSYRVAQAAGLVPLLWVAFVVAAPVGEEIVFRGFAFRGWAASPLGVPGTILLTSVIFSIAHTQYDWFGTFQAFCIGALFAWLRARTGSTTVTILLHMAVNSISTLWSAVKVAGLV
jgi:membrane protease YdiL (CAAX protease family)